MPARCAFGDFRPAPYDHIIEHLGPVTVREFRGRVTSDHVGGPWPDSLQAVIEVHGAAGFSETVLSGAGGTFASPLKPGTYCFKLATPGFRSILGTITIDPRAARLDPLTIELLISE